MTDKVGYILNILTLTIDILILLIIIAVLLNVISHLSRNRVKREEKVIIVHCFHIYFLLLIFTTTLVSSHIQTLLGDLYGWNLASPECIGRGYLSLISLNTLYWSFVNQAFFRLCRIVYSTRKWLQVFRLYILISSFELAFISILLCPLLFWRNIVYLPREYYCFVHYTDIRAAFWAIFNVYGSPLLLVSLIYLRITIFLRRQSNNQTLLVKQRQHRDLLVIQRLLIIIALLTVLGIPAIVLLIMFLITGEENLLFYRIEWLFVGLSMVGLSLATIASTSQLKRIITRNFQRRRIQTIHGTMTGPVPLRHIINY